MSFPHKSNDSHERAPRNVTFTAQSDGVSTLPNRRSRTVLSPCRERLIRAGTAIKEAASEQIDFHHSALCQVGLPRKRIASQTFERRNGRVSVRIDAGALYDGTAWVEHPLPYGVIPRLVMVYLSSEAVRTQRQLIEVGDSVRRFLERLGMSTSGGPRGGYAGLRRQLASLAACRMSIGLAVERGVATTVDAKPIRRFEAWLQQDGEQRTLWPGVLELSDEFYGTLIEHAVPLDPRALAALRHSALALDVYAWMAHRLRRVAGAGGAKLSWMNLHGQFGQEYANIKDFKKQFRLALRQTLLVYPDARVAEIAGGVALYPSRAPIQPTRVGFSL